MTNRDELWGLISQANDSIKQTQIKRRTKNGEVISKDYAEVNQRIKAFRFVYPKGQIKTQIVYLNGEVGSRIVCFRAEAYDDEGLFLADGYAEEKENASQINSTSFIENCQTSAIGRCLGIGGFGIDTSIASLEEVETAQEEQDADKTATSAQVRNLCFGYTEEERKAMRDKFGVKYDLDLPRDFVKKMIDNRKDLIKSKSKVADAQAKARIEEEPLPFY